MIASRNDSVRTNDCHRRALAPSTTTALFYRHLLTCANGTTTAGACTRSPKLSITVITYFEVCSRAKNATRQLDQDKCKSNNLRKLQYVAVSNSIASKDFAMRERLTSCWIVIFFLFFFNCFRYCTENIFENDLIRRGNTIIGKVAVVNVPQHSQRRNYTWTRSF